MEIHLTRRFAQRAVVIAACTIALVAAVPIVASAQSKGHTKTDHSAVAANHLKQIHQAAKKYGKDNNGHWPPLDDRSAAPTISMKDVYPDYVTDPRLMVNPANVEAASKVAGLPVNASNLPAYWNNGSYWYLGYAMTNEQTGLAFVRAYKAALAHGHVPTGDITVPMGEGDGGGSTIFRLRDGVGTSFIQNINNPAETEASESEIPVMISRPVDGGGNVLFMDGHVEFMKYPGKFPMTPAFISALESLDHMTPAHHNATTKAS